MSRVDRAVDEISIARFYAKHTPYEDLVEAIAGYITRAEGEDELALWVSRLRAQMSRYFAVDLQAVAVVLADREDLDRQIAEAERHRDEARSLMDGAAFGSTAWRAACEGVEFWIGRVAALRAMAAAGGAGR